MPKKRSHRWVSTSIPESHWRSDLAQLSSAEYHVNNLVSPVLFQEGLQSIPENAVVVEIAPHALLQVSPISFSLLTHPCFLAVIIFSTCLVEKECRGDIVWLNRPLDVS